MSSHYADYLKERAGREIIETPYGFAVYTIKDSECYIEDIYVIPSKRQLGVAAALADQITATAKAKGCKYLTGSVCPTANSSHASMLVLIAYGMRLFKAESNVVYFIKDI